MTKKGIKCPVCRVNNSTRNKVLGVLPCDDCLARRRKQTLPDKGLAEMVGDDIKRQRKDYGKSVVQPYNSRGELSKEYIDAHGTKGIKATPTEIKKAKNIWDGAYSPNYNIKKAK